jgi:hypothetical protein
VGLQVVVKEAGGNISSGKEDAKRRQEFLFPSDLSWGGPESSSGIDLVLLAPLLRLSDHSHSFFPLVFTSLLCCKSSNLIFYSLL